VFRMFAVLSITFALGPAVASAQDTAPCDSSRAASSAQARVQATCVRASETLKRRADDRGEGYRVRVEANACSLVEGDVYRCRFRGFIGDLGCRGVVRTTGHSHYPRQHDARLTFFRCVS